MTGYLTIEDLTGAFRQTRDVVIADGQSVKVQSLSDEAADLVRAAQFSGWQLAIDATVAATTDALEGVPEGSKVVVDVGDILAGEAEANRLAVAHGLLVPELTIDQVKTLHPAVVEKIGKVVRDISGLAQTAQEVMEGLQAGGLTT